MNAKPWQIAVIALGLLVGTGATAYSLMTSNKVDLANTVTLVDVQDGSLFRYRMQSNRSLTLPARHPDTRVASLIPIDQQKDGTWLVSERDLTLLNNLDKSVRVTAIDPSTGQLKSPAGSVKSYTPPPWD